MSRIVCPSLIFSRAPSLLRGLCIALLLAVTAMGAARAEQSVAEIQQLRFGVHEEATRLVLDLSAPVAFRVHTAAEPYRVLVDLPAMRWRPASEGGQGLGLIRRFQYGDFTGGHRLVLHTDGPAQVSRAFLLPGDSGSRFVLDLAPTSVAAFTAGANRVAAGNLQPVESPTPDIRHQAEQGRRQGRSVIVLDPGHGGVDPGAIGVNGVHEKAVALAVALRLRQRLEATGRYRVVMTRSTDKFLPLRKRIEVARDADADLFISLHADSVLRGRARGSSVYTLSETASDAEAAALARSENRSDALAGFDLTEERDDVTSILIDLAQRETMNKSRAFANLFVQQMGQQGMRMVTRPHRSAGFAVLKAPDVPSVLIELGFLSDDSDANLLTTPQHQEALAGAISATVDGYFGQVELAGRL